MQGIVRPAAALRKVACDAACNDGQNADVDSIWLPGNELGARVLAGCVTHWHSADDEQPGEQNLFGTEHQVALPREHKAELT